MRLVLKILVSLLLHVSLSTAVPYNPATEIKKGVQKGFDITKQVADFTPTFDDITSAGKDLVLGTPFQVILEGLNQICSLALATEGDLERTREVIPQLGDVRIKFLDMKYNRSFNVESVGEMLQLETFNKDNPTVIVTTGWLSMRGNKTSRSADKLLRAYQCRGNYNFILFDSGEYIATIYTWSARNTETLGEFLGEFLVELGKHIDMDKVHVIGHSLGAQISGEAGRKYLEKTDKLLPRITALDPARPCFNEGEVLNGVGRGDAAFVDVIHTNNGALGQRNPIGDADFYPNGVVALQPGSLHIGSSHKRAIELYAESVLPGNEHTFLAAKCNSLYSLNTGLCLKRRVPMGFAATNAGRGNFFLKTAGRAPYGETKITTCRDGQPVIVNDDVDDDGPQTGGGAESISNLETTESKFAATGEISSTMAPKEATTMKIFLGWFDRI